MVGYIASLRQNEPRIPAVDTSWVDSIAQSGGSLMEELGARKSYGALADRIGGAPAPAAPQQGGFLSRLMGGGQQQAQPRQAAPMTAPVQPVQRQSIAQGLASDPVQSVMDAAPATGAKSASQAAGVPEQVGQQNPMELAKSLVGKGEIPDRDVIKEFLSNGGVNLDPATTAWCAAYVNSTLAQSGYKGTGSNMARSFLNYGEPVDQPQQGDLAVFSRGDPNGPYGHVGFFDGRNEDGTVRVLGGNQGDAVSYSNYPEDRLLGYRRPVAGEGGGAPSAVNAMAEGGRAPVQTADASGGMIAPGVTPVQRGGVKPEDIQFLLRDPNLRDVGVKLWAANAQGQDPAEPWQFINLPDGTLARANQQTGAVERLGSFAKPQEPRGLINAGDGRLYNQDSGEWITAPGSGEPEFRRATPEEAAQYGAAGGQISRDGRFYPINPPSGLSVTTNPDGTTSVVQGPGAGKAFTEGQSKDNVYSTRARGALPTADEYADYLADYGNSLLDNDPTGIARGALQNPDYQVARTAADEFLQAILRKDTGAAITEQEQILYGRTYFPVPGDDQKVRAYKREARQRAVAAIEAGMTPAQIVAQERALAKSAGVDLSSSKKQSQPAAAPPPGTIEDGYRFKGGNPSDPNSWEPAN